MYHGIVLELQKRWQTPCRPMRVQDVRSRVVIKLSNVVILYFSPFQYGYKRSRDNEWRVIDSTQSSSDFLTDD